MAHCGEALAMPDLDGAGIGKRMRTHEDEIPKTRNYLESGSAAPRKKTLGL